MAILRRLSQPNTVLAIYWLSLVVSMGLYMNHKWCYFSTYNWYFGPYLHDLFSKKLLWWTHNLQRSCSMFFFFQNRSQPNAHHLPCFCTHLWFPLGTPARYLASWLWQPPMHLPVVFGNFEGIRQVGRPQLWPFTSYKYLTPIHEMYNHIYKQSYN